MNIYIYIYNGDHGISWGVSPTFGDDSVYFSPNKADSIYVRVGLTKAPFSVPGVLESASMMKPIVQRPHRFGCRSCASTSNMTGLGAGAQRWMMLDEGNGQNWEES